MSERPPQLRYVMCPGSLPNKNFYEEYNKVYECWREILVGAYTEIGEQRPVNSELFTRQDYIGAVFNGDECVALCFYRWADANHPSFAQDSYFYNWSPEHIKMLCSRGPRIIVCSNFMVHPKARGTKLGISGKDLLMGMVIETFIHSKADGMTGAVRVNRHVNEASVRWGGYEIAKNVPSGMGNENAEEDFVDLIGFFKDHIASSPQHSLKPIVNKLWNERMTIPRAHLDNEYTPTKSAKKLKVA